MTANCPIGKQTADSVRDAEFPFCSETCRIHDLGNWASERYRISEPILEEPAPDERRPDDAEY